MKNFKQKRAAFTLAEVLITLGIISIVAVLTLPTLLNNNRNHILTTQLKRNVSMLENAFQLMIANDMVDNLSETRVFNAISGTECRFSDGLGNCDAFLNQLSNYVKITKKGTTDDYKYKYIKSGSNPIYPDNRRTGGMITLNTNAMIMRAIFNKSPISSTNPNCLNLVRTNGCYNKAGELVIDVNGKKGPNIEGRDIFDFNISDKGHLIPFWSQQSVLYSGGGAKAWDENPEACGTKGKADAEKVAKYGSGCAARIIDNDWKMDY